MGGLSSSLSESEEESLSLGALSLEVVGLSSGGLVGVCGAVVEGVGTMVELVPVPVPEEGTSLKQPVGLQQWQDIVRVGWGLGAGCWEFVDSTV